MASIEKSSNIGQEQIDNSLVVDETTNVETGEDGGSEITEEAVSVREGLGKDLEDFYSVIKNEFSDGGDNWTLSKLAAASTEKLGPIIQELRSVLTKGGSAEPDVLIKALITEAQNHASKGILKHDFLDRITSMDKISPDSKLAKFNEFAAKGLK